MEQDVVREQLKTILEDFGIKSKFIAKKLGWDYYNLIKFKNGQYDYKSNRLEQLEKFLNQYK